MSTTVTGPLAQLAQVGTNREPCADSYYAVRDHEAEALTRWGASEVVEGSGYVPAGRVDLHDFARHRKLCVYLAHRQLRGVDERAAAAAAAWRALTPHLRPGAVVDCPLMSGGREPVITVDGVEVVRIGEAAPERVYPTEGPVTAETSEFTRRARARERGQFYRYGTGY